MDKKQLKRKVITKIKILSNITYIDLENDINNFIIDKMIKNPIMLLIDNYNVIAKIEYEEYK